MKKRKPIRTHAVVDIRVSDFIAYDFDGIWEWLQQQDTEYFTIIVPRKITTRLLPETTYMDFYCAAYLGQLVYDISEEFSYVVPPPEDTAPFVFSIRCIHLFDLTSLLLAFILHYYKPDQVDRLIVLNEAISFFSEPEEWGSDTEIACEKLLNVGNKLYSLK